MRRFPLFLCLAVGMTAQSIASAQPTTLPTTVPTTRPASEAIQIKGALIISIDGLRPDLISRSGATRLLGLMDRGSFTLWAKTTPQSITLPSHVSMLTGVNPNVHGIQWNGDLPLTHPVYPASPTIFELAHRAGYTTALATGKSKFDALTPPETLTAAWITRESSCLDSEVADHAVEIIRQTRPDVMFVHLPNVDNAGHGVGWGTPEQLAIVKSADDCIGRLLDAYREIGRLDSTLVIVTADHGGAGRSHGPEDPRSRTIPWIAVGPGVRPGFDLTRLGRDYDVQTYDTFSTVCWALGLKPQKRVEGKPILEMFENAELVLRAPLPRSGPATAPATQSATAPAH